MKNTFSVDGKTAIDLGRVIETRAIIQANSGAGKSYLVRKFLEETHGRVQHIVLDMEGEFSSLREKFDYILAGKGGDISADPKSAELLARKILELEASLIVDLYELKKPDRIRFVRNFVDALVNAPKELYHPVLVVIDEAHVFVPEKGESEAASAVIDLATRGRKRGFAAVLATQRLSKLNKDVAAECLNKFIGRTSLDIDRKRAADELGWTGRDQSLALRNLAPGEFFVFGPAISQEVQKIQVAPVQTTHPKAGQRLGHRQTKPTEHIREVLKKLTDLPKEAEQELRDRQQLQSRIRQLEKELRTRDQRKPDPQALKNAEDRGYRRGVKEGEQQHARELMLLRGCLGRLRKEIEVTDRQMMALAPAVAKPAAPAVAARKREEGAAAVRESLDHIMVQSNKDVRLGRCERAILGFLAVRPETNFTVTQVAAMSGYARSSGGFNNAVARLNSLGLVHRPAAGTLRVTPLALENLRELVGDDSGVPVSLEDWINRLGKCEREIYRRVLQEPESLWTREELAELSGYQAGSGGYNNALARLSSLGLIERHPDRRIGLNHEMRELLGG